MALNTIEELIEDFRQGKMVILMDDEDRENEGDLVMAASHVTADDINFMAKYGRGLICLTLTKQRCQQLRLPLMVSGNSLEATNFTLSIEASEGVTTGISAADRAVTVLAAVADDAHPGDLIQPGHIFPLMSQPGGVLTRAGHTEAGCDLARLAGLPAASVIVEILNDDGTMARLPDLEKFAPEHHLKMGTIADLIRYRIENEKTVERISECKMPTRFGDFKLIAYEDAIDNRAHFALVKGNVTSNDPTLVRVHMHDSICDLFHSTRGDCGWSLSDAMESMGKEESAVIVILNQHDDAKTLFERIESFHNEDRNVKVPPLAETNDDYRTFGLGAQILSDLGVGKMRVLGSPRKLHGLAGFGLEIIEYVSTGDR
jgi:3,4-dihydroxy 2-butanone 4-phosphate synthase / GTP cyclohydrolase II